MSPPLPTCTGCGAELAASSQFCDRCGTDVRRPGGAFAPTSRDAQISVVLGFMGITLIPLVCSIAAVWLALRARRETSEHPELAGSTAALLGLCLGVTGIGLVVLLGGLIVLEEVVR
jgi:hypothetical protein